MGQNIFAQKRNQQTELAGFDLWQAIKQQKINLGTIAALTLSYSLNILANPGLIRNTQVKLNIFLSHPPGYYILAVTCFQLSNYWGKINNGGNK